MNLVESSDVTDLIRVATEMSKAYSSIIASDWIEISAQSIEDYKRRFSESAWSNEGFQYLLKQSKKGTAVYRPSYANASPLIESFANDTMICTIRLNLLLK